MMFKKFIVTIFVLSIFSSSVVFAGPILLVTLERPPIEYIENGQPKGINIEIVKEGLNRMGYDCKIDFVPWKRALFMVKNGMADGIIDAAYNKERAEYLHFPSEEIYVEEWYGFKRKDSDVTLDKNFANAGNITLGISRGFFYGGRIQEAIDINKFKSTEEVHNIELNITKLVSKRFDIFVGVKATILFLAKKWAMKTRLKQ